MAQRVGFGELDTLVVPPHQQQDFADFVARQAAIVLDRIGSPIKCNRTEIT